MSLSLFSVSGFRNLSQVEIEPAERINIISGANAAGKTSLLEAIHFLGRVRSFRSTRAEQLLSRGAESILVRTDTLFSGRAVRAAVQKTGPKTRVRIDGEDVRSLSRLAQYFPLQVINSESQRLLLDGPRVRRSFLNWSLFHVEHEYYRLWRRYDRAVRQRNAALRARDARLTRAWEPELVEAGVELDRLRQAFVRSLATALEPLLRQWLPEEVISLSYRPGWNRDSSLADMLAENRQRELEAGYCLYGPHRSDLNLRADGVDVQHRLSRGQQKMLVVAILLTQSGLTAAQAAAGPILLIDDLPAELDAQRLGSVMGVLERTPAQSFLTCVDAAALNVGAADAKWFHVEHGDYREVV